VYRGGFYVSRDGATIHGQSNYESNTFLVVVVVFGLVSLFLLLLS
jgi:hypothetical protein